MNTKLYIFNALKKNKMELVLFKAIDYLNVFPSSANYFLCSLNNNLKAHDLTKKLLSNYQIYIKDLTGKSGFEGKEYVRIAVRDRADNDSIINALEELKQGLEKC